MTDITKRDVKIVLFILSIQGEVSYRDTPQLMMRR